MAKLNKLSLKNYRDLKRLKFPLEHPSLLILGANGSGKTQLLHSLLLYFRAYNIHCVHDQNVRRTPSDSPPYFSEDSVVDELSMGLSSPYSSSPDIFDPFPFPFAGVPLGFNQSIPNPFVFNPEAYQPNGYIDVPRFQHKTEKEEEVEVEEIKGKDKKTQRQISHTISEKKRQQTINQYIDELKKIIPTCGDAKITKVTILQRCVNYVLKMKQTVQELKDQNEKLKFGLQKSNPDNKNQRKISFLISYENDSNPPFRIDSELRTIEEFKEMLERVANFDQTKMQITYLDPEFDNEQVQLDSLENLPSKARIIIRTLQNDVQVPVNNDIQDIPPLHSHSHFPSSSSSNPQYQLPLKSNLTMNYLKDSIRIFMFAGLCFGLYGNYSLGTSTSFRTLNFFSQSDFQMDQPLTALYHHMAALSKFFFCFTVFRFLWHFRSSLPEIDLNKIDMELAKKNQAIGDQLTATQNLPAAKEYYFAGLRALGHNPDFFYSLTALQSLSLLFNGLVQHLHRYQFGIWIDQWVIKFQKEEDFMKELSYLYFQLFKIQCFHEKKRLSSVTSLLLSLNYSECCSSPNPNLLSEIYVSMSFVLNSFFPWGTTIFLGVPGGYYRGMAQTIAKKQGKHLLKKISQTWGELEEKAHPLKPIPYVFLVMLAISFYEYTTGHEIISVLITGHILFEFSLMICQLFLPSSL